MDPIVGLVNIVPEKEGDTTIKFLCWAIIMFSFVMLVYYLMIGTTHKKKIRCKGIEGFYLMQEDSDLQHY